MRTSGPELAPTGDGAAWVPAVLAGMVGLATGAVLVTGELPEHPAIKASSNIMVITKIKTVLGAGYLFICSSVLGYKFLVGLRQHNLYYT
jgi:hypothetical protein